MIVITMERNARELFTGFTVKGHASYAAKGEDIICAAVSAITQTAVMALQELLQADPDVKVSEGYLSCRIPETKNENKKNDIQLIIKAMILGLEETAKTYKNYLKIDYIDNA